jgi:hypothetical protein
VIHAIKWFSQSVTQGNARAAILMRSFFGRELIEANGRLPCKQITANVNQRPIPEFPPNVSGAWLP